MNDYYKLEEFAAELEDLGFEVSEQSGGFLPSYANGFHVKKQGAARYIVKGEDEHAIPVLEGKSFLDALTRVEKDFAYTFFG